MRKKRNDSVSGMKMRKGRNMMMAALLCAGLIVAATPSDSMDVLLAGQQETNGTDIDM